MNVSQKINVIEAFFIFTFSFFSYIFSQKLLSDYFNLFFSIILSQIIFFFFPILYYLKNLGLSIKKILRFNLITKPHVYTFLFFVYFAIEIFIYSINYFQYLIFPDYYSLFKSELEKGYNLIFQNLNNNLFYAIFAVAVVPAFVEELIFRGFLQKTFETVFNYKIAIVLTSIIFAFVHFSIVNFVSLFVLSIILGFVVYYTNSIFTTIIIHFLVNFTTIMLNYYFGRLPDAINFNFLGANIFIFLIALILIFLILNVFKTYFYNHLIKY